MRERCSEDPVHRQSYWVLKGVTREFYVCTTAGRRDWRIALCVFDSEVRANKYLQSLGGARAFVEIMQRYEMQVPDWMLSEPQLPETCETTAAELYRVTEGLGMEHVTINPPPVEPYPGSQRADVLALVPVEDLGVPPHHTGLPNTTVQIGKEELN